MFGFAKRIAFPQLMGQGIELRLPSKSDHTIWQNFRQQNGEFLTPFIPKWSAKDLSAESYAILVKNAHQAAEKGTDYSYFIFDLDSDGQNAQKPVLVGGITLSNVRYSAARHANVGYWLGENYIGKNFMGRAIALCQDFAFNTLKLNRIHAACLPDNQASINVLRKAGFEEEGFAPQFLQINGTYQDHNLYGLTATRYMTIKGN